MGQHTVGRTNSTDRYSGWNIDNPEVTSNPVYPAEGTMGAEFTINGSGFGTKKGKVLIGNTSVTVLGWGSELIRGRLTKTLAPGVYDVRIVPSEPKGSPSIIHKEAFVVKSPESYSIDRGYGTAWDQIAIHGKFFGTSKGKIYLRYEKGGNPVRKNCKVLKWTMDPTTGDGELVFVVPTMLPEVCDVVVDPYGALPEAEEEDSFTVKAPEIVSVEPNGGSTGEQISIHGRFFGTKKGKVYLSYEAKGKPRKKSCTVVSWTVDPSSEEGEGDIVLVVPKGLAAGHYDLIVTNSAGSGTGPDILTIQ